MTINTTNWQEFKLIDLFDIQGIKPTPTNLLKTWSEGMYPHITASTSNNGCSAKYDHYTEEGNVLTIESAASGCCFYQALPFSAGGHVEKLVPKFDMTYELAMFFVTLINTERSNFNYGRKCTKYHISKKSLKLPTISGSKTPDWELMKDIIKNLQDPFMSANTQLQLPETTMSLYKICDLFTLTKGKRLLQEDPTCEKLEYIGATAFNNGVTKKVRAQANGKANTITIAYNGSVGEVFYHPKDYFYSDDIICLESKYADFNVFHALYICTVLKKLKEKYYYGYKLTLQRLQDETISLPGSSEGPDYEYMKNVIMSGQNSDLL